MDDHSHLVEIESPAQWSTRAGAATLVLIHDGSGTTFSYHCLGPLRRPFYVVANPLYESGGSWEGGIPEMARHYVGLVRSVVAPGGDLIVGGWSLGGLIALEMANILASERERERERGWRGPSGPAAASLNSLNLLGVVMIDSVCAVSLQRRGSLSAAATPDGGPGKDQASGGADGGHIATTTPTPNGTGLERAIVQHAHEWGPQTRPETKERVLRCFAESGDMIMRWDMPRWRGQDGGGSSSGVVPVDVDGGSSPQPVPVPPPPPRAVLLRAQDAVPMPPGTDGVGWMDVNRDDRLLGWGEYYGGDLIVKVVDVPGHHHSIFHMDERLDVVTQRIREACELLEEAGTAAPLAASAPAAGRAAGTGAAGGDVVSKAAQAQALQA